MLFFVVFRNECKDERYKYRMESLHSVVYPISTFLEIRDMIRYASTNKDTFQQLKSKIDRQINIKRRYVRQYFPDFIIDTMNGMETMIFSPILQFEPQFEGSTGYLDELRPNQVQYPIMIGVDDFMRPFITFKLKYNNNIHVETLFQRYSSCHLTWTWGSLSGCVLQNYSGLFSQRTFGDTTATAVINDFQLKENIELLLQNNKYIKKRKMFDIYSIKKVKLEFA